MRDITGDMQIIWSSLASVAGNKGATVMFIGARAGDGVSSCARAFAKLSSVRSTKSVWLIDLDFYSNGQFNALGGNENGNWSGPFDMSFGKNPFWWTVPRGKYNGKNALVGYRVGATKLYVSKFRREELEENQVIQIGPAPEFWQTIRENLDITIIDAPPLENSHAGLALVSEMDGVVLVIDAENTNPKDAIDLKDEVIARGGNCLGIVLVTKEKQGRTYSKKNLFNFAL